MKKLVINGILLILVGITYMYKDDILKSYYDYFVKETRIIKIDTKNKYYRDYNYLYVQNTNNFEPKKKQDIINIIYTVLNSGLDSFTFYCPKDYKNCMNDVKTIANDQVILSSINNYVHPYNSFSNIETETDTLGKVKFKITKSYTDTDIKIINEAVKNIEKEIFNSNLSTKDQIKIIHDYIINNSKYDSNRTDNGIIEYKSDIAYGPLIEGYGICGGYSDAMALFLDDLNINNFKVASNSHVWNAVNLYNTWSHLDLTWDDPVTNTGEDFLDDKFFLINTNTLHNIEPIQHEFDINVYKEFSL